MKIIVAALGCGGKEGLTLGAYEAMRANFTVFRTQRHDAARALMQEGIRCASLDGLYEQSEDFDSLSCAVCQALGQFLQAHDVIVYAVPGGAGYGDSTVRAVLAWCAQTGVQVECMPGQGYFEQAALACGAMDGCMVCPASQLTREAINTQMPLVLTELDSRVTAGEVKVLLMDFYPESWPVTFVFDGKTAQIPLYELDRQKYYDHRASIAISPVDILKLSRYDFTRLREIVRILRGKGAFPGCPWDIEQTHESLRTSMIEEAYEAVDAINSGDPDRLCDELGDVLLQVAMHAQIASEFSEFDDMDVTTAVCAKMILRHPHIFGDAVAKTSGDVLKNWEIIKQKEKGIKTVASSMRDIPGYYPALMRAAKIHKKAANVGFDFPDALSAMDKLSEEMAEVKAAMKEGGPALEDELGDLLFASLNVARLLGVDGEVALNKAADKFVKRFEKMEELAAQSGVRLTELDPAAQDALWNQAKILCRGA